MNWFSGMQITGGALDQLMPMHLVISSTGHIAHAGPTLQRLGAPHEIEGARFLEVFRLRSPRLVQSVNELRGLAGRRLKLQLREAPYTGFKGLLAGDGSDDLMVLNLSFGISILDAIRDHDLHAADFAPTDMSVELLYLMEAKSAAMDESRKLNSHLQAAKIAAEEQAFTDTLTGLKNRRALSHILDRYTSQGRAFALMQLDLDFFKQVNDSLGHAAGDHVLQQAGAIMVQQTRSDTSLVRAGGDEFVLIFPDLTDAQTLMAIATRLIEALEVPIPFGTATCNISGSIGITIVNGEPGHSASDYLEEVDQALYASKRAGRGRATLYTPSMGKPEQLPSTEISRIPPSRAP